MSVISKEQIKRDERSLVIFLILFNVVGQRISAGLLLSKLARVGQIKSLSVVRKSGADFNPPHFFGQTKVCPTPTLTRFWRDPYNSSFPDDPPQKALSLPTLIYPAPL